MASVYTAELTAINAALKALSSGTYNCNCVIYSDSRSALPSLRKPISFLKKRKDFGKSLQSKKFLTDRPNIYKKTNPEHM